jgi:hypothetical protein
LFLNFLRKWPKIGAFFGASPYELKRFEYTQPMVRVEDAQIVVESYPFEPSIAFPCKIIKASEIRAYCRNSIPTALIVANELIFLSVNCKTALEAFVQMHQLHVLESLGNWDWITEPFLDTEFSPEAQMATLRLLSERGIAKEETARLRAEIAPTLIKYNFDTMLWEWAHLGLFDVLLAMRAQYNGMQYAEFYHRAIEVEMRGWWEVRGDNG